MGHGASTVKDVLRPLLVSQELIEGSARLADDPIFRLSFTNYIKAGSWLDRLAQLVPDSHFVSNGLVRREKDHIVRLREYNIDNERMLSIEGSSGKSDKFGVPTSPTLNSSSKSFMGMSDPYGDMYQNAESSCFSPEDLLTILFTILFPIYLSSHEYERFVKYGIEHGAAVRDEDSTSLPYGNAGGHVDTRMIQTNQSKRAQELLLGCAAYFDESLLQEHLLDATWLQRVCAIFHDFPMAVCIVDTTKIGLPFVYVNKAFCQLTGYHEPELLGANLSILNSPQTEAAQLKLMHNSVRSTETVKFSISLQTKSKRPLFDLVAQKAVGSFSISAHFVKSRATNLEALNVSICCLIGQQKSALADPNPVLSFLFSFLCRWWTTCSSSCPTSSRPPRCPSSPAACLPGCPRPSPFLAARPPAPCCPPQAPAARPPAGRAATTPGATAASARATARRTASAAAARAGTSCRATWPLPRARATPRRRTATAASASAGA